MIGCAFADGANRIIRCIPLYIVPVSIHDYEKCTKNDITTYNAPTVASKKDQSKSDTKTMTRGERANGGSTYGEKATTGGGGTAYAAHRHVPWRPYPSGPLSAAQVQEKIAAQEVQPASTAQQPSQPQRPEQFIDWDPNKDETIDEEDVKRGGSKGQIIHEQKKGVLPPFMQDHIATYGGPPESNDDPPVKRAAEPSPLSVPVPSGIERGTKQGEGGVRRSRRQGAAKSSSERTEPDLGFAEQIWQMLQEDAFEIWGIEFQWIHVVMFAVAMLIMICIIVCIYRARCRMNKKKASSTETEPKESAPPVADMV